MFKNDFAGIQYWGEDGITQECLDAVMRLLQYDDHITKVRVLTDGERYCLLVTVGEFDLIAIKSGFSTGYSGEGPRKLSLALALLEAHKIEMDEFEVSSDIIERINDSALTKSDLEKINSSKPVRPLRIYDYIDMDDFNRIKDGTLWQSSRPVVPFAIIDPRIMDLAITFFDNSDDKLLKGYRRLEDILRERIGSEEHGADLFQEAFLGDVAKLHWKGLNKGEQAARANLFMSAYRAHRNPRAHKEEKGHSHKHLSEFLLLNHLFLLEREALS